MANADRICAYCAEEALRPDDPPEHVVPHALGASFTVSTVCHACNSWASREIDQPFLTGDYVRILRNVRDVRPPGARRDRMPSNPLLQGVTEDGTRAWVRDGKTYLAPTRTRDEKTGTVRIRANSVEEAERLAKRVERDAAERGEVVERQPVESGTSEAPLLHVEIMTDQAVWARMAAKIALATASHVYEPAWRSSPVATDLRHVLRDEPSEMLGEKPHLFPDKLPEDFSQIFAPQEHALWCNRVPDGRVLLSIVLFGDYFIAIQIGAVDDEVPTPAWRLDSRHPRRDGKTDFFGLLTPYLETIAARNAADESTWGDPVD
ncbi:HNH endonuclease [Patulibacter sp. S7RM1-6]